MHHALLYIQPFNTCEECISSLQKELSVDAADTRVFKNEKFLVDDARDLVRAISMTPMVGEKTLTVVAAEKIDREAQNALLKVAEEPPVFAHIALMLPSEDMVLPTLLSRFVRVDSNNVKQDLSLAKEFLAGSTASRQKLTTKIVKDKDHAAAKKLIHECEVILGKNVEEYKEHLSDLVAFHQYIEQRGASIKFMLEHMALSLPQVK
ncbi:MAG: hypothetical protein ACJKSS_02080 [Patescibacteria group bacterium UBA2103]